MSALGEKLARHIRQSGPISLADYMHACLLDPEHGYYATRDPLGTAGDFITAPEISQMFGELVGLSLAQSWLDQGAPDTFALVELGPGRGTLMADILRATKAVPGFHAAAQVTLVEASPVLRQTQQERLADFSVNWVETVTDLPEAPLFLVANEFLDALPIRQFLRQSEGWRERLVGLESGALGFGLGGPVAPDMLNDRLGDTKEGQIVETCAPARAIVSELAQRIAAQGGVGLLIDYGGWCSMGDTFQALANHKPVDPFATPGEADLTAHVDFAPLAREAKTAGAQTGPLVTQGVFLERLGITARAQKLAQTLSADALNSLIAAHRRLTHPDEMGNLFKVLAIAPTGAALPPGTHP
ncbi:MAG: class I SAM-dependent methyltransferase [Brevirhabdus sp.]